MPNSYNYESIAKMIDHSLLNPTLTAAGAGGWLCTGSSIQHGKCLHHALLPGPLC